MKRILPLFALPLLLVSCASILNDSTQKINVATSNNIEANITIDGKEYSAPAIIELPRQKKDIIIASNSKKCIKQTLVKSKVDNIFWINILSGGTFGSSTDYGTDKMWAYEDNVLIQCKQ